MTIIYPWARYLPCFCLLLCQYWTLIVELLSPQVFMFYSYDSCSMRHYWCRRTKEALCYSFEHFFTEFSIFTWELGILCSAQSSGFSLISTEGLTISSILSIYWFVTRTHLLLTVASLLASSTTLLHVMHSACDFYPATMKLDGVEKEKK